MTERALKPGWKVWRFDQIAENVAERVEPGDVDTDYYVGLEHIDPDSLKIRRWGQPADVEATKLRFREGDIIFGRRRAYQRKLAVAEFDGICSAHAMVLRPRTGVVLPEFLPFFMQSDLFMNRAVEISVGSLSPTINWRTLAPQRFALPPLTEQPRIFETLIGIEESLESLTDLESRLESLRKSYIIDTFSRMLNEHTAKVVSVANAGEVLMGRQRSPKYEQGISPRPYLRVANVFDGYIDTADVKTMDFSDEEFEKYRLIRGDILLNEGQSRELVGRSSIFQDEVADCCFQNTLLRFRPTSTSSEYAQYYFQFCLYTGRFAGVAKQTTSIAHLGAKRFALMEFPLMNEEVEERIIQDLANIERSLQKTSQRKTSIEQVKRFFLDNG